MSAAARYLKGCKMLERYEGKLSRTVLRRGGASNRLFLVYDLYASNAPQAQVTYEMPATRITREPVFYPLINADYTY